MSKKEALNQESFPMLFGKRNFIWMLIGIACIALGFILMSGSDANTNPDGVFDPNYWNPEIFSWRRIRLAPFLVILGFVIEVYAIWIGPKNDSKA